MLRVVENVPKNLPSTQHWMLQVPFLFHFPFAKEQIFVLRLRGIPQKALQGQQLSEPGLFEHPRCHPSNHPSLLPSRSFRCLGFGMTLGPYHAGLPQV